MNILETDHWCLMLPSEWQAENDDDIIRIVDQDEVGEIEITTLHKQSGKVMPAEIQDMAREECRGARVAERQCRCFFRVSGRYRKMAQRYVSGTWVGQSAALRNLCL